MIKFTVAECMCIDELPNHFADIALSNIHHRNVHRAYLRRYHKNCTTFFVEIVTKCLIEIVV